MKDDHRLFDFLGGRSALWVLGIAFSFGAVIWIYSQISFIFHPLVVMVRTVVPPVILAFIAYYLFDPLIGLLERFHVSRTLGVSLLMVVLAGAIAGIVLLAAPVVENQVQDLARAFPGYLRRFGEGLERFGENSIIGPYYQQGYRWISERLTELPQRLGDYFSQGIRSVRDIASTLSSTVMTIVTFPIVLFFLLKDGQAFRRLVIRTVPPAFRADARMILDRMDTQVGSYIHGQLIVATVIGLLLFLGYLVIGLDYAFTLAIIAGVTSVVPYVGPTVAIIPAGIIAIVNSPFMFLKLIVVWVIVQFSEGNFITPNIMGRKMNVHPLTIIFVLLVAGNLFGFVGVILGIPGYAVLRVLGVTCFEKFKKRYDQYYGADHGRYDLDG